MGNRHILTANDIGWPQQHRIAKSIRSLNCFLHGFDRTAFGAFYRKGFQQRIKALPVLSQVNAFGRSTKNRNAMIVQVGSQLDRGLPAKCHNNTDRFFNLNDAHDIFRAQRFKVEPVGRIKIGRDGLRVIVYDDDIVAHFPQRPDTMDRRIIKLDALPDPDRTGAKHHDDFLAAAF